MSEPKEHPGRPKKAQDVESFYDDLEAPVDLEPSSDPEAATYEVSEFEPDFDEDAEFDEEPEFESDFDSEPDFGPGPKLAPGPKHGPGHHPGPRHEHGPGPGPGPKKGPGKKAPGKKAPGKKAPGPKKHAGHHPGPPHEHGPEHGPGHHDGPPHEHGSGHHGPGPQTGLGFGPGPAFGFGPGGFGPGGFGPGARGRGSGRRGRRGDIRAAILSLLAERPMHGYEMIKEIAERSQDLWRPSPGSVYPTLQLLDDEGLIGGSESEGSKKLFELTDGGRSAAEKVKTPPWEEIAEGVDQGQVDLRAALGQLVGAVTQAAYVAAAEQQQRIVAILKKARREIYTLLAESE